MDALARAPRLWRESLIVSVLVVLSAVALWLSFGVTLKVAVGFVVYVGVYTLLPGVVTWLAVTGSRRMTVSAVALGWALGYALELGAFVGSAALGVRGAFAFYPLVVLVVMGPVLWHRRNASSGVESPPSEGNGWMWCAGVVVAILFVYIGERSFTLLPLPWQLSGGAASYPADYVWQLSVAAEARHHWPIDIPNVAGERLEYHWFVFAHMAAVNQVTGIDLATVDLRLFPVPIVALVALLFVALGRELGGSAWVGVVALVLAMLAGPFDPLPRPPSELFTHIYESASYGYGLVLFLALATLLAAHLREAQIRITRVVLIGVLAVVAAGAKSSILPVLLGGLGLVGVWVALRELRLPWRRRALTLRVLVAGLVLGVVFLVTREILYPHNSAELEFKPIEDASQLFPARLVRDGTIDVPEPLHTLLAVLLSIPSYLKLLAPLAPGLWLALRRPSTRRSQGGWWTIALAVASLTVYSLLWQRTGSQAYFLYYGLVAVAAFSAVGLVDLWRERCADVRLGPRGAVLLAAAILLPWIADGPPGARAGEPTTPSLYRKLDGQVTWDQTNANLTPALYEGFRWVRAHTPGDAVLATNNRWQDAARVDARYFYVSALTERRTLLEGYYGLNEGAYDFATQAQLDQRPRSGTFGDRAAAIQNIFVRGDRGALRQAQARWGVTHLVVDLTHLGPGRPDLVARLGHVVYRTPALLVVDVR